MDRLLQDLRGEGYFDGEGHFTLDPRRARELLRQFQLGDPYHYILHLVSFAVGQGAAQVQVSAARDRLTLKAEGCSVEREIVRNPLAGLFSRTAGRARSELAIGINTALRLPRSRARLATWDGKQGWLGTYRGDEFELEAWEQEAEAPMTRITVERPLRGEPPEVAAVEEHFRFSPVPVKVDQRQVSGPVRLETERLYVLLAASPGEPATRLKWQGTIHWLQQHQERFTALVEFGADQDELSFLWLGRLFTQPGPWRLAGSELGLRLVVATDRLDKDLSQTRLVDNRVYKNLLRLLKGRVLGALAELASQPEQLESQTARASYRLFEYLVEATARAGQYRRALGLQEFLVGLARGGRDGALAMQRLALLVERRGDLGKAQKLRAQARSEESSTDQAGVVERRGEEVPFVVYADWSLARIAQAVFGSDHPPVQSELARLGQLAERTCPKLAEDCWRLFFQDQPLSRFGPDQLVCWGRLLFRSGRLEEARTVLRQATSVPAADDWAVSTESVELQGMIEAEMGDAAEASRLLAAALETKRRMLGDYSVELGLTLQRLASLAEHLGERANAKHYRNWASLLHVRT